MTTVDGRPAADRLDGAVFKVVGVVVLGAIMSILDVTVVTVALPTFQAVFGASYAIVAWTMTGYTLAVLLTNRLAESPLAGAAIAARSDPAVAATLPGPTFARGLSDAASAFAGTFGVAMVLVLITLVPALLLARQRPAAPVGADPGALVLMH
jgi:MFS family permease